MYAKYVSLATATQAQMLDDICKLMTGTPIANLSASCDKTNTKILANSLPNNWTVYDAAASASAQVLRSLNTDGVSYKYAHLSFSGTTLSITTYESWNPTTHVGTNQAMKYTNSGLSNAVTTAFSATVPAPIYIYATSNMFAFGVTTFTDATLLPMVIEFTRDCPILDSTYPCHALGAATFCRIKYGASAGDFKVGSTPALTSGNTHRATTGNMYNSIAMVNGSLAYFASPMYALPIVGLDSTWITAGKLLGLYFARLPNVNPYDELEIEGTRYIVLLSPASPVSTGYIVQKG